MPNPLAIAGLSVSKKKGDAHAPVKAFSTTLDGIDGDRHAGPSLRQVSFLHEDIAQHYFPEADSEDLPGMGQENILLAGDGLDKLRILDTLEAHDAILEVTQIGKSVSPSGKTLCGAKGKCLLSDHGLFARIAHGGTITSGTPLRHQRRLLRAHIITVSDRASAGRYKDKSGPAVRELLEQWCAEHHWALWAESQIIPDDRSALESVLSNARQSQVDLVLTTGGTGVAPRDITPDVVCAYADKIVPGIMEHIRLKYGAAMPMALTSRGVAATMGAGLIYTLPGSSKAIPEYLEEIFKTMEHMLILLKGLDAH